MTYQYVCQVHGCSKSYVSARKAVLHELAMGHTSFRIVLVDSSP